MANRSSVVRKPIAELPPKLRSRVGNGRDLLPNIDGRSAPARRAKEIQWSIIGDLGGAEQLSETRLQLVRRFAMAVVMVEQIEAQLIEGGTIDIEQHAKLSATLVKLSQRIGLGRHAKTIPSLQEYLASKQQERDDSATDDTTDANVIEHEVTS